MKLEDISPKIEEGPTSVRPSSEILFSNDD